MTQNGFRRSEIRVLDSKPDTGGSTSTASGLAGNPYHREDGLALAGFLVAPAHWSFGRAPPAVLPSTRLRTQSVAVYCPGREISAAGAPCNTAVAGSSLERSRQPTVDTALGTEIGSRHLRRRPPSGSRFTEPYLRVLHFERADIVLPLRRVEAEKKAQPPPSVWLAQNQGGGATGPKQRATVYSRPRGASSVTRPAARRDSSSPSSFWAIDSLKSRERTRDLV